MPPHVPQQIQGGQAVNRWAGGMKDQAFLGGEGIEVSPFVLQFGKHLEGTAITGAFEQQMFEAMRYSRSNGYVISAAAIVNQGQMRQIVMRIVQAKYGKAGGGLDANRVSGCHRNLQR